jgi:hypothetical protein
LGYFFKRKILVITFVKETCLATFLAIFSQIIWPRWLLRHRFHARARFVLHRFARARACLPSFYASNAFSVAKSYPKMTRF